MYKYLLLLLVSCSHVNQNDPTQVFDYESIEVTVKRFSAEFNIEVDSTLHFEEGYSNGFPGRCIVEANHIVINKQWWLDVLPTTRQALLFHELGHCMLKLGHDPYPGIMNGFVGHTVNHYNYFYEQSIQWMKGQL